MLQNGGESGSSTDSNGSTPSPSFAIAPSANQSAWSNWPGPPFPGDRPHTISSAYERNHNRPSLTAQTFEPPERRVHTEPPTPSPYAVPVLVPGLKPPSSGSGEYQRPPMVGPKPRARPVALPTVPDFNMTPVDQSKDAPGNVTFLF